MYPNFLCIGTPKAGTTWLFDNLCRHPDVWLPKYKSVQYFSGKADAVRRKKLRRLWRTEVLKHVSLRQTRWDLRYFLHRRLDDCWYASLFEAGRGHRAIGEIAPSYTALDEHQVDRVHQLMPHAKIIFLLRSPVERLWSHAMLTLVRNTGRRIEDVGESELRAFFASDAMAKRTDYVRTYRNWSQAFGPERIFVGFFEDISRAPGPLLASICQFLDIDADLRHFELTKDRNIFKGLGCPMPAAIQRDLYQEYAGQLQKLALLFGGPANDWYQQALDSLDNDEAHAA